MLLTVCKNILVCFFGSQCRYLCNKAFLENYAFLIYIYYMDSGYQTSIFGKNCAYYIWIFSVITVEG